MIRAATAIIRARVLARFNPCDRQSIRILTRRRELNSSPSSLKIVSIQGPEYTIVYNSNQGSHVARILQPCGSISTTKYACCRALSEQGFTASRPARSLSGRATGRGCSRRKHKSGTNNGSAGRAARAAAIRVLARPSNRCGVGEARRSRYRAIETPKVCVDVSNLAETRRWQSAPAAARKTGMPTQRHSSESQIDAGGTTRGSNEESLIQAARRYLWHQSPFSSINSLICPMARVGFSPLGQTSTQFMML